MRFAFLILILSITIGLRAEHPLHLSVVNMNLDEDSNTLNYSIRLFQEDLIVLLGILNHEALHKNQVLDSNAVHNYICNVFNIYTDENIITPELIRKESSELEYWLFYKINLPDIPDKIIIQNKIFIELFLDQQNLVIFSYKNKEKGLTFNAQNQKQPIDLDCI